MVGLKYRVLPLCSLMSVRRLVHVADGLNEIFLAHSSSWTVCSLLSFLNLKNCIFSPLSSTGCWRSLVTKMEKAVISLKYLSLPL